MPLLAYRLIEKSIFKDVCVFKWWRHCTLPWHSIRTMEKSHRAGFLFFSLDKYQFFWRHSYADTLTDLLLCRQLRLCRPRTRELASSILGWCWNTPPLKTWPVWRRLGTTWRPPWSSTWRFDHCCVVMHSSTFFHSNLNVCLSNFSSVCFKMAQMWFLFQSVLSFSSSTCCIITHHVCMSSEVDFASGGAKRHGLSSCALQAVMLDSTDVNMWFKIGLLAVRLLRIPLARHAFEEGLQCNPDHWPCLDNLITILYTLTDYTCEYGRPGQYSYCRSIYRHAHIFFLDLWLYRSNTNIGYWSDICQK